MSTQQRQKRAPINCEPCRIRKIRCGRPRGPPPCPTCVRRSLASECVYAHRNETNSPVRPLLPPSPLSEISVSTAPVPDEGLAARVARLESMLRTQSASESPLAVTHTPLPPARSKGKLSVTEAGHVRFIPTSHSHSSDVSQVDPQKTIAGSIDLNSGPFPFGRKRVDDGELLAAFPPRYYCSRLKDIYFVSFAPLFHLLHDPTFHNQYSQFERDPESMPPSWLALLYAIIGTAVTALEPSEPLLTDLSRKSTVTAQIADLSERFRGAALHCLEADNYLWQHNITTLQALIILIYGINHSHGQTWSLLGLTYHISLSLGCHVDPSEFGLDVVDCEQRRRCWAGVMMLYMLQNTSLGHLGPDPRHAANGVRLPVDLNDIDLRFGEYNTPLPSGLPTQMSYLLLKFKLYDIASEISSLVLSSPQPPAALIDRMDRALLDEQQHWNARYLAHSSAGAMPIGHEAHLNILHGYAHQLTLLLHHQAMNQVPSDTPRYLQSVSKCMESARGLLHIHSVFISRTEFAPFGWYLRGIGSFHAFHAAVSLIALVVSRPWKEAFSDIIVLLRDCVQNFENLSRISLICEKAAPILRSLLNTIETWSLEIGCRRTSPITIDGQVAPHDQLQSPPESLRLVDWLRSDNTVSQAGQSGTDLIENMIDHLDPQLWLTPSNVSWHQWESLLVANCVG